VQKLLIALVALLAVGVTSLIALNVIRAQSAAPALSKKALPQPIELQPFTLTNQAGQPFGSEQLRGKAYIATFIFSRCAGVCPTITDRVARLQEELKTWPRRDDIRLVSISVDPYYETPETLTEYAKRFKADTDHWVFLRGDEGQVRPLVTKGFLLSVVDQPENTAVPILHSEKFVLVDRQGRIRGYYDALKGEGKKALLHDLKVLLE
jgi:protein SCO1/2